MKIKNPIVFADYSDPDIIRVGDTFYLTASSFNYTPGLPILTSSNLADWRISNYAIKKLGNGFELPRHSEGVWAPSIRFHKGYFYIYYGMPDEGLFVVRTKDPLGDWEPPHLLIKGKGLIDSCPFFDDDGRVYLVHAYAKSRIGFKSMLGIYELSPDGMSVISKDKFIFNGNIAVPSPDNSDGIIRESAETGFGEAKAEPAPDEVNYPAITIEGPKVYKRNGFYYILAPAGGVVRGWQLCLRSKSIYGPYECRVVMHSGNSVINGPHQGGLVDTGDGSLYFIHFQDRGLYGRICHIEPFRWTDDDWCVIGEDKIDSGIGKPVYEVEVPDIYYSKKIGEISLHNTKSDRNIEKNAEENAKEIKCRFETYVNYNEMSADFPNGEISSICQWMGDFRDDFICKEEKAVDGLCLRALNLTGKSRPIIWESPNVLTMKLTRPEFKSEFKLDISRLETGDRAGVVMTGGQYAFCEVRKDKNNVCKLICGNSDGTDKEKTEIIKEIANLSGGNSDIIILRFNFIDNKKTDDIDLYFQSVDYNKPVLGMKYSLDGMEFKDCGIDYTPSDHTWVGAKLGVYAISEGKSGGILKVMSIRTV